MDTGTYISGIGHVAVIGWALIGSSMFTPTEVPEFQVTDVSVISEAAFAAMVSDAPLPSTLVEALRPPDDSAEAPEAPKPEDQPKLAALPQAQEPQQPGASPDLSSVTENPRADVQLDAPVLPQPSQTVSPGASLVLPDAPLANRESLGARQPDRLAILAPAEAPSPRVDTTPAPKPPTDAEKAREAEQATTPDPDATVPAEPVEEKAPDQASTEIITEAKEKPQTAAPVRSARPKGRPARLGQKPSTASEIEKALARAQTEAQAQANAPTAPAPSGPPLTGAEKDRLRLAVQSCWNVNPSSESARITVTVSVKMERSGAPIVSSIRLISATDGSDSAQNSAYAAARRAIIRCAKGGYQLPVEKYERWREIEMVFNPDKMRIR